MPDYFVHLRTEAYTTVKVTAANEEEAEGAALNLMDEQGYPRICAYCSGMGQSHNLELSDAWDLIDVMEDDR